MISILTVVILSAGTPSFADQLASEPAPPEETINVSDAYDQHHYHVKLGTSDYVYEEPDIMKIHGRLYQLESGYRDKFGHASIPFIYGGNFMLGLGNTTYDGGFSSNGAVTPFSSGSKEELFDIEGFFGAAFFDGPFQALEVYSGIGYWSLYNKIEGKGSYNRETYYVYLPTGLRYVFKPSASLKVTVGAQYNLFVLGQAKSHLSELTPQYDDVTNEQNSGSGTKFTLSFEFPRGSWDLVIEGFYQGWSIADSNIEASGGKFWREPHNTTKVTGVNIGGRF